MSLPSRPAPTLLHLSTSANNGGADRHAVTLADALQRRGWSLHFACPPGSFTHQLCTARKITTHPFPRHHSRDIVAVLELCRLLRRQGVALLHSHARRDFVMAILAGRLARCPVVLQQHVVRPLGEPLWLAGKFFNQAHAIITVSDYAEAQIHRWHSLRPGLVRRIYNGVDIERFTQVSQIDLRVLWGFPPDSLVVGMIGRLTTKGQQGFLRLVPSLVESFPTARFVFVGPGEGDLSPQAFQQEAQERGVGDRVIVPGISEDIPAVMKALDLLIHLPSEEAFGLALVEAAASGVPAITTRVGGCAEVVEDGVTGYLVALGDDEGLLGRTRELLGDSTRRTRFGTAAKTRAQERFSQERQVSALEALYLELTT